MKIYSAPYVLKARTRLNNRTSQLERHGALLRIEWASHLIGFADCFPWPEFGDEPLAQQLASLIEPPSTILAQRALANAYLDATARSQKLSLFNGLDVPRSHYLSLDFTEETRVHLDELAQQGFKTLKLKIDSGRAESLNRFSQMCAGQFKLRMDANCQFSAGEALDLASNLERLADFEFWEDPCPYDPSAWSVINAIVPLALDFIPTNQNWLRLAGSESGFDFIVHKPSHQDPQEAAQIAKTRPLCVTSYMDHPLGQCFAAYHAARLAQRVSLVDCGLQTHHIYINNAYSEILGPVSPRFTIPPGHGIGFDDLLERSDWRLLRD